MHGYLISLELKKVVVSVVTIPSRDFLVLKHFLKTGNTLLKQDQMHWIWLTFVTEKLTKITQI